MWRASIEQTPMGIKDDDGDDDGDHDYDEGGGGCRDDDEYNGEYDDGL